MKKLLSSCAHNVFAIIINYQLLSTHWYCARYQQHILNASYASVNLSRFTPVTYILKHFFKKMQCTISQCLFQQRKYIYIYFFKSVDLETLKEKTKPENTVAFNSSSFMLLSLNEFRKNKINSWKYWRRKLNEGKKINGFKSLPSMMTPKCSLLLLLH